jgi:hypothetical protein
MANSVNIRYGGSLFSIPPASGRAIPLVTIDTVANRDIDNNILSYKSTLQLEGTIIGTGLSHCLSQYSGIETYFSDPAKQNKTFEIICDGFQLSSYSGTYFVSSNAARSENNWVVTLPYSISLESIYATGNSVIESYDDSWTIEPLEEVYYFDYTPKTTLYEYKSSSTIDVSKAPSQTDLETKIVDIPMRNFLQYRITHRLSAVGKAIDRSNPNNPNNPGLNSKAYHEAAKWVKERADVAYGPFVSSTPPTGIQIYNKPYGTTENGLRLYNHMRTVESNVSAGSYGITDTWLALGTGVKYTEDFTWEISTDDKFLKTVAINGTIKGLEEAPNGYVIFPSSLMTGYISDEFLPSFKDQTKTNNKFINAINGYMSGVKPYLYERASAALSSVPSPNAPQGRTLPVRWIGAKNIVPLNITPLTYTETLNPIAGSISYNVSYNNKPGSWLSGVLSSTLNITDNRQSDVVAETFVLGRPLGPILEKVGNSKSERRVNLEVLFPVPTGFKSSHPQSPECVIYRDRAEYKQMKELMDAFKPIGAATFASLVPTSSYSLADVGIVFKTSDSQTWTPFEGRFSWDITWVYTSGFCS